MHDPLFGIVDVIEFNTEILAIGPQRLNLLSRNVIHDGQVPIHGGDVVIFGGKGLVRSTDFPGRRLEPGKRLGAGDFVDQMQVDIQQRLLGIFMNDMLVPDFFEKRFWIARTHEWCQWLKKGKAAVPGKPDRQKNV